MRQWLQRTARRRGYEIRKAPRPKFDSVSVFDLAMHYLVLTRGEKLTFIEVGANDGRSGDPMREYILKYRWRGLLVEPQPEVFERLKANYEGLDEGLAFENVAISSNPEPIQLFRPPTVKANVGQGTATVASANPKVTAKQLHVGMGQLQKIDVPTARLDDLILKHGLDPLDILQIDTEGYEWDVLQTLDLTKVRPLLIRFEHGHLSPTAIGEMTQHLNVHGYDVSFGGYEADSVALRKDFVQG